MQQAEAVDTQKEVLRREVAHSSRRREGQMAGLDVLQRHAEFALFRLAAVNGGSDKDGAIVYIRVPQAKAVDDHGAKSKGCIRHRHYPLCC